MNLRLIIPGFLWHDINDAGYLYSKTMVPNFIRLIKRSRIIMHDFNYSDIIYSNKRMSKLEARANVADCYVNKVNLMQNREPIVSNCSRIQQKLENSVATHYVEALGITDNFTTFFMAEPTHLRVDLDQLLISEAELLQLNSTDSQYIIQVINAHFADSLKIYYIHEHLWLIGLKFTLAENKYYPIIDIIGENINDYLPSGNNSILFSKILNEIQMLLYNLDINKNRRQNNLPSINSIWMWDKPILSNNWLSNYTKLTDNFYLNAWLELDEIHNDTLLIDDLFYPCCYRDSDSWIKNIEKLDIQIAQVLNDNITNSQIKDLSVFVPMQNKTLEIIISRNQKYKFWKNNTFYSISKDNQ